jgi:hypothetical protein
MHSTSIESIRREMEESWKVDHLAAMECMKLQEKIASGISFIEAIEFLDNTYSNAVRTDIMRESPETAEAIESLYRLWLRPCPEVFARVQEMEGRGFEVDGATSLRAHYDNCRIRLFGVAGTQEALEQVEKGQTLRRAEAMNELRRRIFPQSSR